MPCRPQTLWRTRRISNFAYIMLLNLAAGRTYNDFNQYPVFPWVLADYSSAHLDLKDPKTFRNLFKPVGALNPDRVTVFRERYQGMVQDKQHSASAHGASAHSANAPPAVEPFMYGTHYSNVGAVNFFLLRVDPMTTSSAELQGGRFDVADRLFHNMGTAYANVLKSSSDLKELIPELFYLPELLQNRMGMPLGTRQDGKKVRLYTYTGRYNMLT